MKPQIYFYTWLMLRRLFPDKYNLGIFKARLTDTWRHLWDRWQGSILCKKDICHVFDVRLTHYGKKITMKKKRFPFDLHNSISLTIILFSMWQRGRVWHEFRFSNFVTTNVLISRKDQSEYEDSERTDLEQKSSKTCPSTKAVVRTAISIQIPFPAINKNSE